VPPGLPPFFGGAVGYFAFEAVRHFERCGQTRGEVEGFPEAHFLMADSVAVFDNVDNTVSLVQCVHPAEFDSPEAALAAGMVALDTAEERLFGQPIMPPKPPTRPGPTPEFTSNLEADTYKEIVAKAKEYIKDGDIIQVVLAQHFSSQTTAAPLDLYRALRYVNPSPYLFYLRLDDKRAIAGSSPEVMVRVDDGKAHIRPIAGTRPRGVTPEEDRRHASELLADPKERAEHVMLVDLARNDLGRIAVTGSVIVRDYMVIEHYSHVMHIVSDVEADVREECDALDVFKASFPAGTLSGAPKVRAMEIIHELEPDPRGPYGGALGYVGYGGKVMDMAITIRTLVYNDGEVSVTAGAGIVHDSVPEMEYQETMHKSQGMKRAVALAEHGLRLDAGEDVR
jgi:anthranilate synthase component 1